VLVAGANHDRHVRFRRSRRLVVERLVRQARPAAPDGLELRDVIAGL